VELATPCKDGDIVARVTLRRRHEANGAVAMLLVVPSHEARDPRTRGVDGGEALRRVFGAVLECTKQGFGVGVVVGDTRATEGRHDAEAMHRREHRRALHRTTIVGVEDPATKVDSWSCCLANALDEVGRELARLRRVHIPAEDLAAPDIL